jgi:CheY-like chemotaxis protein
MRTISNKVLRLSPRFVVPTSAAPASLSWRVMVRARWAIFVIQESTKRVRGNPKAVLFDLRLAEIDGLEMLRGIKTDADLKAIPAVMPTWLCEGRHVLRSYNFGMNSYVRKPMIYHDLVESIEQVGHFLDTVDRLPGGEGCRRLPACTG